MEKNMHLLQPGHLTILWENAGRWDGLRNEIVYSRWGIILLPLETESGVTLVFCFRAQTSAADGAHFESRRGGATAVLARAVAWFRFPQSDSELNIRTSCLFCTWFPEVNLNFFSMWGYSKNRRPSEDQEETTHQTLNLPVPPSWTSQLPELPMLTALQSDCSMKNEESVSLYCVSHFVIWSWSSISFIF